MALIVVEGTPLPYSGRSLLTAEEVRGAVSELARAPFAAFARRGPARSALVGALKACTSLSQGAIGEFTGVSRTAVCQAAPFSLRQSALVTRIAGDPRFPGLLDGPLPWAHLAGHFDPWA